MAPFGGEWPPKREGVEDPERGGVEEVKEGKGECVPCLEGMILRSVERRGRGRRGEGNALSAGLLVLRQI